MKSRFVSWRQLLGWLLLPILLAGLSVHFARLLQAYPPRLSDFQRHPVYLLGGAGCYVAAHTIWGTFFWQLLRDQGTGISWFLALRAYFVSQVGKYLPGKAWVILLRVLMLRGNHVSTATVGVCGVFETLISMAAGAMLSAALLPYTRLIEFDGALSQPGRRWWIAAVGLLPLGAWLLNRLIVRIARRTQGPGAPPFPKPSFGRLLQGLVQAFAGWILLSLGLVLVLQGLSAREIPSDSQALLGYSGANALAYIAGFVLIFLPGGLGAREELLQRMLNLQLRESFGETALPLAVVTAIALRTLWTVAELGIGLGLYLAGRTKPTHADSQPRASHPDGLSAIPEGTQGGT